MESRPPPKKKIEEDTVVGIHVELTEKKMLQLKYPGGSIECTEDHLIWSEQRSDYVQANKLYFNERVRLNQGKIESVEAIKELTSQPDTRVYHLTIKNNHNFFVFEPGSTAAILVHNQDAGAGGGQSEKEKFHFHETYIGDPDKPPKHEDQKGQAWLSSSGGGGQSAAQGQGQKAQAKQGQQQEHDPANAKAKRRLSEKGFITDRVGKDVRTQTHEDGSAFKAKDNHVVASKKDDQVMVKSTKPPIVNQPWVIMDKKYPLALDDK